MPRDFLLKTGLKSDVGPVEPDLSVTKSNWAYAVSNDTANAADDKVNITASEPAAQQIEREAAKIIL